MAVTAISVSQDNVYNYSNLIPVHSPVIFVIDVTYTDTPPDSIKVNIYDEINTLLDTYNCIPYADVNSTLRQFIFIAHGPIRCLMNKFDDILQANNTIEYVEGITKALRLEFTNIEETQFDELTLTFIHGASQFGQKPNKEEIFNNDSDIYYGQNGSFVYVYFYNDSKTNAIGINGQDVYVSVSLGNWNMDMDHTRSRPFAIPSGYQIKTFNVMVYEDDNETIHDLSEGGTCVHDGDSFELTLDSDGYFLENYSDFDGSVITRGYINVTLEPI